MIPRHARACSREAACILVLGCAFAPAAPAVIVLDGRFDEPEWTQARRYDDFRVVVPYRLTPAESGTRTLARLLSTPEGIVVGFELEQSERYGRVKPRLERDQNTRADRVGVMIDFDGDGRTAYSFSVDLSGSVQDGVLSNENQLSTDWDTDWTSAVTESESGWQVELLIPWTVATMRGADTATREVAVYFSRTLGMTGEQLAFPALSASRAQFASGFQHVEIAQYRKPLFHVWPYATANHDRVTGRVDYKAGADVFWKPSPTFQLSATFNPDFGQVESDDLVISFDAVETFYSDRRAFFTENQSIFALTTPDAGRLVHTRRIGGDADDGTGAADIDAAVKLNGSLGMLGYGLMAASERGDAGRDFHAARLHYPLAPGLSIGWLGTHVRRPFLDRDAQVQAVDLSWRHRGTLVLDAQVLASDITQSGADRDGTGAWLRMFWMPSQRWTYEVEATRFDKGLDFNDLGYQRRGNLDELEVTGVYLHRHDDPGSRLSASRWSLEGQLRRNHDGDRLPDWLIARSSVDLRSGNRFFVDLNTRSAGWDDRVSRGNGLVWFSGRQEAVVGFVSRRYKQWSFETDIAFSAIGLGARTSPTARAKLNWFPSDTFNAALELAPDWSKDWLIWESGRSFGRYRRRGDFVSLGAAWFPGRRHELRLKSEWVGIRASAGEHYLLSPDGRLQPTTARLPAFDVNNFGVQLRYRYLLGPQSDVFLAWSRGGFRRLERASPTTPDFFDEALSLSDADQWVAKIRCRF